MNKTTYERHLAAFTSAVRHHSADSAKWHLARMREYNEDLENWLVDAAAPRGIDEIEEFLGDVSDAG